MSTSTSLTRDGYQLPGSYSHPNPMFDFLTGFVPRKLKDLFRWTEYLYANSGHIFQALTKLANYIITDITIDTDAPETRKEYEELFKTLKILPRMKAIAQDRMIYGNAFVSLHFPFNRFLVCSKCSQYYKIDKIKYSFDAKKEIFGWKCVACGSQEKSRLVDKKAVVDMKSPSRKRINIIRWDPKLIDIDHNPITGQSQYYYNIPTYIREAVKRGNKIIINNMPRKFLHACREKEIFEFHEDALFHLRIDAPAGIDTAWGFPPLTATLKLFYYTQVLKRANEAIALDHLTPFRVLHPAQTSGNNDPVTTISMARWVSETQKNIKLWRRDPLHIMFAPVALGVTQMGGQGRTLMTLGEVQASEDTILATIGVPKEFFHGGLSFTGSSVTLRMLENQLRSHTSDMEELLQWISDRCARYFNLKKVKVGFVDFKFVDDVAQKSMLLGANGQYNFMSTKSVAEVFDVDYEAERKQQLEEQLAHLKEEHEQTKKMEEIRQSLAAQAAGAANQGAGLNYDQQAVFAEAQGIAEQLSQMDETMKRSELSALQSEDFVMYAVVVQVMQQMRTTQMAEVRSQM